MPRKRTVTAEETTTVTRRVTATETTGEFPVLAFAPGWDPRHTPGAALRHQRQGQVRRCLDFLALWAMSAPPGGRVPGRLVPDAAIILRAGPGATPLELILGRSI